MDEKQRRLHQLMDEYADGDVAVAFSGGADSGLLLKLAVIHAKEKGTQVLAVTASTELHPAGDMEVARKVALETGAKHMVLEVQELQAAGIELNPVDRCYRCKKYLFKAVKDAAKQAGAKVVLDGTNADDLKQYRPGLRALEELGIQSPLKEAGLTKAQVRQLAAEYGISVANRPAAPCLATRFPYGEAFTADKLRRVGQGEDYLKSLGLYNVRLRVHGDVARIEADEKDLERLVGERKDIARKLKALGYGYVSLDLEGFRSGSMDEGLLRKVKEETKYGAGQKF